MEETSGGETVKGLIEGNYFEDLKVKGSGSSSGEPELAAEKIGITKDDIDWFVPHQANVRIIETAAKKLGVPMDKFVITLDHYGNTSSASIPLALCEAIEKGMVKKGQKLALIGFGAGLTYGGIILEY